MRLTDSFGGWSARAGFLVRTRLGQSAQLADLRALHAGTRSRPTVINHGLRLRFHRPGDLACYLSTIHHGQVSNICSRQHRIGYIYYAFTRCLRYYISDADDVHTCNLLHFY